MDGSSRSAKLICDIFDGKSFGPKLADQLFFLWRRMFELLCSSGLILALLLFIAVVILFTFVSFLFTLRLSERQDKLAQ